MRILQIALYLAAFNVPCVLASGHFSEQCSQKNDDCEELVRNKCHYLNSNFYISIPVRYLSHIVLRSCFFILHFDFRFSQKSGKAVKK